MMEITNKNLNRVKFQYQFTTLFTHEGPIFTIAPKAGTRQQILDEYRELRRIHGPDLYLACRITRGNIQYSLYLLESGHITKEWNDWVNSEEFKAIIEEKSYSFF